jgi:hypothetical protein
VRELLVWLSLLVCPPLSLSKLCTAGKKKRVHRIIFHLTQELEKQTTKMNEKLKMKIV